MGINVASSFTRRAGVPLDDSSVVADLTARDAIEDGVRYEGMEVVVISENKKYRLVGGITDSDWEEVRGGGGGGGSFQWHEGANAPVFVLEDEVGTYLFADADDQYLYGEFKVPNSYSAGDPITLRTLFRSTGTSGDVLFQTRSTLIRTGTDNIQSTTNQRTSTNSAITLSAGTNNEPQAVVCDLTDTDGTINSVAVSAGDLIKIRLTRNTTTDTSTADAKLIPYATEVS